MKKTTISLIFFALCIFPNKVKAWGTTGHRVIAEIAERNINEDTKKEIAELLDNQHLAYWANWADFIKSDKTTKWDHTYVWHYVNASGDFSKEEYINTIKKIKQNNLYSQTPILIDIVKDTTNSKDERKEALVFLIHLIGDAHQPMHTGREEDRGGNKIKIQWFWQDTNLHTLWDSKLVDFEKYSYTEYATVLNVLTDEQKQALQEGQLEDWLYDSHLIANELYSTTKNGDSLSYDYNYMVRPIVNTQLQKGGLRLAKLLNEIFSTE